MSVALVKQVIRLRKPWDSYKSINLSALGLVFKRLTLLSENINVLIGDLSRIRLRLDKNSSNDCEVLRPGVLGGR